MSALPSGWDAALGEHAMASMRYPLDASCWRLTTGAGRRILFDAGSGLGPAPEAPDALLLTHGHVDHAGGAARLAPASRIVAGALTASWLADGNEEAVSLDRARRAGIYPAGYRLRPCLGIEAVADGARLAIDDAVIEAVATPGHCDDHIAWLVTVGGRRTLVGGDALFTGGTVILQDTWDCSVERTCSTIRRIAALAPDDILPGHGPPLVGGEARSALDTAMARVDRLLPPALFL